MLHTSLPPTIAQQAPPTQPPAAVEIPLSVLFFGGVSVFFAVGKWLLGREITRLDSTLTALDARIKALELRQGEQQVEAAQVARLDHELATLERLIASNHERQTEALGELRERTQRMDNVGYALQQTQELLQANQKEVLRLEAAVTRGFVSEEKFVRDMTVLTSRVDAVWARFDEVTGSKHREQRYLQPGGDHGSR